MVGVRQMMGLCPQSNVMSADLTCDDQLRLFAQLRGIESSDVEAAVRVSRNR